MKDESRLFVSLIEYAAHDRVHLRQTVAVVLCAVKVATWRNPDENKDIRPSYNGFTTIHDDVCSRSGVIKIQISIVIVFGAINCNDYIHKITVSFLARNVI